MTAEQRLELALRIIEAYSEDEGYLPRRVADDYEALVDNINLKATFIEHTLNESAGDYQTIQELKEKVKAADELAALVEQGECPWREDTHNYQEWWEARLNAAQRYRRV
jgi:hypothetical protein